MVPIRSGAAVVAAPRFATAPRPSSAPRPSFKCSWSLPLRQSYSLNSHPMRQHPVLAKKSSLENTQKYECLETCRSPCLSSAVARRTPRPSRKRTARIPRRRPAPRRAASAWTYVGLSGLAYTFLPGCAGADSTVVIRPSSSSAPSRRFDVGASMAAATTRFGTRGAVAAAGGTSPDHGRPSSTGIWAG